MIDHLKAGILTTALAQLIPFGNGTVHGTVTLIAQGETVQVLARVSGLTPGLHAFHLHERGDCTSAAATCGHVATDGTLRSEHHGGEFGALLADEEGNASVNILLTGSRMALGRSIVVHSSPDDFIAWPAPTHGATVACGVLVPTR